MSSFLAPDGTFKPLGFYSAHLNEAQKKYSVFKKELLGAHKSLRHFLPDVYGKHLVIYSDHLPLAQAFQNNNLPLQDPQVYRQITEIGRFTRDIKHVSGIDNVFADFLSRIRPEHRGTAYLEDGEETPAIAPELAVTEAVQFQVTSLKAIEDLQAGCPDIKLIKSGDQPKSATFDTVDIDGHQLFCEVTARPRPYVPKALRQEIITSLHAADHLGIKSTLDRVASEYYWPAIKGDIKNYVKKCDHCNKVRSGQKQVKTGKFEVPDKRFSHVMVDVVGPLPVSYEYRFLLHLPS